MKQQRPKVIAVDFDDTLSNGEWNIDLNKCTYNFNKELIEELNRAREIIGCKIVLWTCRGGIYLKDAVIKSKENGLVFDAINTDVPETYEWFEEHTSPKIYADLYIDDKALVTLDNDPDTRAKIFVDMVKRFVAKNLLEIHLDD